MTYGLSARITGTEAFVTQTSAQQAELARPVANGNRRATIRYRCAPATLGKVIDTHDMEFQRAWILDLSLQGVGMQLSRPLEVGRQVLIVLRSTDGKTTRQFSAHVMHCHAQPQGDWFVGCELTTPLTLDELERFL
jgi:hypothetical protein